MFYTIQFSRSFPSGLKVTNDKSTHTQERPKVSAGLEIGVMS